MLDILLSIVIFMWHSCKVSCFMLDFRVSVVRFLLDIFIPDVITQFVRHVREGTLTIRVRMSGYWKVRNLKPLGSRQCFVKVVQLCEGPLISVATPTICVRFLSLFLQQLWNIKHVHCCCLYRRFPGWETRLPSWQFNFFSRGGAENDP
jgi:hypothetical protein